MKNVIIFGSTGSIGAAGQDVVRKNPGQFNVLGLCANSDTRSLEKQIAEFKPRFVCLSDSSAAGSLKGKFKNTKVFYGEDGLSEFCSIKSDIVLMGISGMAALKPLLACLGKTKQVALANKEAIVAAAEFVFKQAKTLGTTIIPVDSEINALFQLINGRAYKPSKVYLTASGGALFNCSRKDLAKVSLTKVLNHPTWKMGRRITVDSATLVNKAFEVMEAHHFFKFPYDKIEVLIHRQSLSHGMVEYPDGSLIACLYPADMRIPIAFAMHYPNCKPQVPGLDFKRLVNLSFEPLEEKKFPLFSLMIAAAKIGKNAPIVMNACDETAISAFISGKINFLDIELVMEKMFEKFPRREIKSLEEVFYWDTWARKKTIELLKKF